MPKERSVANRIFSVAFFIALEIASLVMLSHNNQLQQLWIMRISHGFMAKTWGATQSVRSYFSLKKQNDDLALENSRLTEMVRTYQLQAQATDSLFQASVNDNGFKYIPATIIKSSQNTQHNYLILDKGFADGVTSESGIITSQGVVGIIDAVSEHYSYAISFQNAEFNISARLGREGAVGPLAWDGMSSNGAILKEIPLQYKFEPGDTVYTSGYSAIFPPDIPLGTTGDAKVINGATNEIKITLFQDHTALKYVTIIENTRLEEITEIENVEENLSKE